MGRLNLVFLKDELRNSRIKSRIKLAASKVRLAKVVQIIDNCSQRIVDLKAKAEPDFNEIKLMCEVVKDLEAERDFLTLGISKSLNWSNGWKCPHCGNLVDEELTECPNCGWHPMPSCAEAYKTP